MEQVHAWYTRLETGLRWRPWFSLLLGSLAMLCFLGLGIFYSVAFGLMGPMPKVAELRTLSLPAASEVYSVDGELLGRYYLQDRTPIPYDSLPPHLIEALLATEDVRFYEHRGIDVRSLLRVLVKSILLQNERAGGGSTLHQQIAKNLYPRQNFWLFPLLMNKVRELVIAERLDQAYSKEELISLYLNTVSFSENVYGIEAAAHRFFGKGTARLTLLEAATLIGQLKAPTRYNPRLQPEASTQRRNTVLSQLVKYEYLPSRQADSLYSQPLELTYTLLSHHDGLAPYLRERLRPLLQHWCKAHLKPDGRNYNLYTDGLKIHTTLDARLQTYAEAAVQAQMRKVQSRFDRQYPSSLRGYPKLRRAIDEAWKRSLRYRNWVQAGKSPTEIDSLSKVPVPMRIFSWTGEKDTSMSPLDSVRKDVFTLHAGFMAMEPHTGHVRVWVGGINHQYFQFDQISCHRQAGSVFKPLVYATALEEGVSPCEYLPNDKTTFARYGNWSPRNSDNQYGGEYSMQGALTHSVNIASVNLILKVGPRKVVNLAQKMGLPEKLPAVPALALGAADVSLQEMLSAYSSFVNGGIRVQPHMLLRIEDSKGNLLQENSAGPNPQRVVSPETAAMITHMLQSVVEGGTARRLRTRYRLDFPIAGKTGTTQKQTDGWFIGATPYLVAGARVGASDPRVHFKSLAQGQGAATALPIWGMFMRQMGSDEQYAPFLQQDFSRPPAHVLQEMDCHAYYFPLSIDEFKAWYEAQEGESLPGSLPPPQP